MCISPLFKYRSFVSWLVRRKLCVGDWRSTTQDRAAHFSWLQVSQ